MHRRTDWHISRWKRNQNHLVSTPLRTVAGGKRLPNTLFTSSFTHVNAWQNCGARWCAVLWCKAIYIFYVSDVASCSTFSLQYSHRRQQCNA